MKKLFFTDCAWMFYTVIFFILWATTFRLFAQQNLVPNSSFEEFTTCPDNGGQLEYALYWTNPLRYTSPDYFNACGTPIVSVPSNGGGYEIAHSGVAYAAIVTYLNNPLNPPGNNTREYMQVELLDYLQSGKEYCIRLYVSACDSMNYVSNNIGIYFSESETRDTCGLGPVSCRLEYIPQFENDSLNDLSSRDGWTEVSGKYIAAGGEKFVIMGNFRDSTTTTATYVGWSSTPFRYYAAYYIDDVYISRCDSLPNVVESYQSRPVIYPNPSPGYFFLKMNEQPIEKIEIFNSMGKMIYQEKEIVVTDKYPINITKQPDDIYLLSLTTNHNKYLFKLLKTHLK